MATYELSSELVERPTNFIKWPLFALMAVVSGLDLWVLVGEQTVSSDTPGPISLTSIHLTVTLAILWALFPAAALTACVNGFFRTGEVTSGISNLSAFFISFGIAILVTFGVTIAYITAPIPVLLVLPIVCVGLILIEVGLDRAERRSDRAAVA
ncbi:hypothetical protein [Leifsonia sp. Leaf264]|uniref:hypothetical protein n=1 Tax=Leifsonia sp. Leaf264 TaxID=1736314 RepID=UPI0006FF6F9F|nr:hypothetical protein [Leifsonia sp. Leaf264]KQO98777.1 hypothetical protein ASF30_11995 [Leifsonia sp. Leaf264]